MKKTGILRAAVIGAGSIGHDHLASLAGETRVRLLAVAETHPQRAQEAAARFRIEAVTDYRQLLCRPDIDLVTVALPNYLHAPVALAALRAGKHVMVDKPLATSLREARAMETAARSARRFLMVGQNYRFRPETQSLKQQILQGRLGQIYHLETTWFRRSGIPRIGSWFTQKKFSGGGCVYDIGVHLLDAALFLGGDFRAVTVSGQVRADFGPRGVGDGNWGRSEIAKHRPFDVEDFASAFIRLRGGATVVLRISWACHHPEPNFEQVSLFGTKASARLFPAQVITPTRRGGYQVEQIPLGCPLANGNRMVHFVDCILGKAKSLVPVRESVQVQAILDAIYLSARRGREVRPG